MRKVAKLGDGAWLRQRYVIEGASISAIAAELGCAIASVRSALAAEAISVRASGPQRKLIGLQADEAVALVRQHGITGAARSLKVTKETFRAAVGWLGVLDEVREASWQDERERRAAGVNWPALLHDRAALARAYETKTVRQIAVELGVARSVVSKALRSQGILTPPGRRGAKLGGSRRV